jgi:hypothetical protein
MQPSSGYVSHMIHTKYVWMLLVDVGGASEDYVLIGDEVCDLRLENKFDG